MRRHRRWSRALALCATLWLATACGRYGAPERRQPSPAGARAEAEMERLEEERETQR